LVVSLTFNFLRNRPVDRPGFFSSDFSSPEETLGMVEEKRGIVQKSACIEEEKSRVEKFS
jgi:hypothetical protein